MPFGPVVLTKDEYMVKSKAVAIWLYACCVMVIIMIVIGGVTRLTGSGLSMTDWKPVTGILPPLNEMQWQAHFDAYRESPEYKLINAGMKLADFKSIFWLEYIHRIMGRLTGVIFIIPLLFFYVKGHLCSHSKKRMIVIGLLGGFQGLIGWWMVSSGLKDSPYVDHFWLAFHLATACIILMILYISASEASPKTFSEKISDTYTPSKNDLLLSFSITTLIFIQITFGALVAGLDAGLIFNSFPDMNGEFYPQELQQIRMFSSSFFSSQAGVQFLHRMAAYTLTGLVALQAIRMSISAHSWALKRHVLIILCVTAAQFMLGVFTLLFHVPLLLGSLHQLGAIVLLLLSLNLSIQLYSSFHRQTVYG